MTQQYSPPERIYLQVNGYPDETLGQPVMPDATGEVTWCQDRVFDEDVEYLRRDGETVKGLVEALHNLYLLCNNVPIRDEGCHQGPIFFGGSPFADKRVNGDDDRFEAMVQAEHALAKFRGD